MRELTALAEELRRTADGPAGLALAACRDSRQVEPWVLLLRDTRRYGGRRGHAASTTSRTGGSGATTLAGTDGGHRGAILTSEPYVAQALGDSCAPCLRADQPGRPPSSSGRCPTATRS